MIPARWLPAMPYAAYRIAIYVTLNLGEDAALVALMFC